jgi:uncharacterized protein YcbK (DUF882 family)
MKNIIKILLKISLVLVVLGLILVFLLIKNPNESTLTKLDLVKKEITDRGYHNRWVVISGHRSGWYNNLLKNSAKKSYHLKGKAIDIFVFDIDGDWDFDSEDIKIIESVNRSVEKIHPELVGALGTYTTKDYFTKHTVHLDTRGYKRRYNM